MHTAFELKMDMFSAIVNGQAADPARLLDWERRDRLGVLIDRPVGALGAGLMILLAANSFYDVAGTRRRQRPMYPDIFLFHVGGPWSCFINFDFWPDHKEVFVDDDPRNVLRAINNRGITHLLLPDKPRKAVEHRFKEPEAAIDRIKQCYAYAPDGQVADADVELVGKAPVLIKNYEGVLDLDLFMESMMKPANNAESAPSSIPLRLQPKSPEELALSAAAITPRLAELDKSHPCHQAARARVDSVHASGLIEESFRRISTETALEMLA